MSSSHIPLLGQQVLALKSVFSEATVVQDYPEKYRITKGNPRRHDNSFLQAQAQGFLYGTRTDNGSNHWTRLILFKPSDALLEQWDKTIGYVGAGEIESLQVDRHKDDDIYQVHASYMKGIGSKVIGYIAATDYHQLVKAAWSKNLGELL